jgi:TonB-linked SusC/RagA family outer membrane protein
MKKRLLRACRCLMALCMVTAFNATSLSPLFAGAPPPKHGLLPPILVKGRVANGKGEPIPGVSVVLKGGASTVTNDKGEYQLTTQPTDSLTFSSIGYEMKTVAVAGRTVVDVVLIESVKTGDEVVVVGYSTQKKKDITAAIATISSKDMEDIHSGATVSAGLAGKVPGVSFLMTDSRPGATAQIQIRNYGNPIYIIDGVKQITPANNSDFPIPSTPFNNLAMSDIESITFLKDASAAVYGVEAANGVVLITTKKGRAGAAPVIGINVNSGWQSWTRFPRMVNNYEWQTGRVEAYVNQGQPVPDNLAPGELAKYKAAATSKAADTGLYRSFDWRGFIARNGAPQQNQSINFSGGSDRINFYTAMSHLKQDGIFGVEGRQFTYERSNFQTNIDARVSNDFRIGTEVNGNVEIRQNPGIPGVDDYYDALNSLYQLKPWERPYANDNPQYLNNLGNDNAQNFGFLTFRNSGRYKATTWSLQTNVHADWQTPLKGLSLRGLYSFYYSSYLINNQENIYNVYNYLPATQTYQEVVGSANPWRQRDQDLITKTTTQLQLNYNRTFGLHSIQATFVNERISSLEQFSFVHSVPPTPLLSYITFAAMDTYTDTQNPISTLGYVGNVNYNYAGKYYLQLMGRRDASYVFPPGQKSGNFASITGGWRVSNEPFFHRLVDSGILSNLKLNASYGTTGDDRQIIALNSSNINNQFGYLNSYTYNSSTVILNGAAVSASSYNGVPVTNLTWVTAKMLNVGLDFGLFENKLTGSVEYYRRKLINLPDNRPSVVLPLEIGYHLPYQNQDKQLVQGFELTLNYQTRIRQVNFAVTANIARSRWANYGVYNPTFNNSLDNYFNNTYQRGQVSWGYLAAGQFTSQQQINENKVDQDGQGNRTLRPGDIIYKDLNKDGVIDQKDTRPIGWGNNYTYTPLMYGGLGLTASWKGLEFRMDLSGGTEFSVYRNALLSVPYNNQGNLPQELYNSHWRHQDIYDPNSAWIPGKYPALTYNNTGGNNNKTSTFWNVNVWYVKCRNLEVGYNLPKKWLSAAHFKNLRIYGNISNLFSLDNTHKYGIDPEAGIGDTNYILYPTTRVMNIGANLTL